tara:strand:+ start:281 stop:442 length:162 start_codon:yes stop_codon:yes gene_type:complete
MEGIILILLLGYLIWMLIRHPLKSLGWIFKLGFLFLLGLGAIGGFLYLIIANA